MLTSFKNKSGLSTEVEDLYNMAQSEYASRDYRAALLTFNKLLKLSPQYALGIEGKVQVLRKLSEAAFEERDYDLAESYAKEASKLYPETEHLYLASLRNRIYCLTVKPRASALIEPLQRIDNLVFQGGGIKGLAYVGACQALSQCLDFSQLKRVGGTSAGAIQALLLALDYSAEECMELMKEVDFSLLTDGEYREGFFRAQQHLRQGKNKGSSITEGTRWAHTIKTISQGVGLLKQQEFGLFPGDYFREEWLERVIQRKTGIPYLTFGELNALKANQPFKDLYVMGVNLDKSQSEVFSYETTPDVIISDALRISMSFPLVFKPHCLYLKQDGKRVPHPEKAWYIDGGVLDNYPIWLFDKACYLDVEGHRQTNPYTLGLKLVDKNKAEPSSEHPESLGAYVLLILKAVQKKQSSDHLKLEDAFRTIEIDSLGIDATEFNLEADKQDHLVNSGKEAVEAYFKQRMTQKLKP